MMDGDETDVWDTDMVKEDPRLVQNASAWESLAISTEIAAGMLDEMTDDLFEEEQQLVAIVLEDYDELPCDPRRANNTLEDLTNAD